MDRIEARGPIIAIPSPLDSKWVRRWTTYDVSGL